MNLWCSWWTKSHLKNRLGAYTSGWRGGWGEEDDEMRSLCAWLDAPTKADAEAAILNEYPDAELRFVEEKPADFQPGDRFPAMRKFRILASGHASPPTSGSSTTPADAGRGEG